MISNLKRWLRTGILAMLLMTVSLSLSVALWTDASAAAGRESRLPAGNAITDPKSLLRNALPIDNPAIREVQTSLEDIGNQLRGKRWRPIESDIKQASTVLNIRRDKILADIPEAKLPEAEVKLAQLQDGLRTLQEAVAAQDKEQIWTQRGQLLSLVTDIEESMIKGFPFEVPEEYSHLPQLQGRATIAMQTTAGEVTVVVDGYSAPVTAGNFVDLVQRGFYDGLEFTRAEDSYVLQVGDPPGPEVGFVDPKTKEYRAIPLEILVQGDTEPVYGFTLESIGRYRDLPVLPFSAYGALGMARPGDDPNGGSSQFFFFLFEPELTPAGLNLLDGRYSVFGYLTEGKEVLGKLKAGDRIESAKVIEGSENLVQPATA